MRLVLGCFVFFGGMVRPFFKSLFVYRVFLRFESQLSTKGNRQILSRR